VKEETEVKNSRGNLIWGLVLIVLGTIFLLQTLGVVSAFSPTVWALIFAGASLIFLVVYLLSGWREWGWLFPTSIFAGLTAVIFLADSGVEGTWVGALFMVALALPFWVAFLADRQANWWALIPGWIFTALTAVILLSNTISGEVLGSLVMFAIGLPFVVVYFANRANWWALIPAGVLCGIGLILLFVNQSSGLWIGALMLLILSLPFLFVYVRLPQQWWAIIPGGILLVLAVITLLVGVLTPEGWWARFMTTLTLWGIAAPFIFLYLQRDRHPTEWAKYPAAVLLLTGVVSPFLQDAPENTFAIVLILIGGWLLLNAARRPKNLKG